MKYIGKIIGTAALTLLVGCQSASTRGESRIDSGRAREYVSQFDDLRGKKERGELAQDAYDSALSGLNSRYQDLFGGVNTLKREATESLRPRRGWRDTLRHLTVEPVKTPENDGWKKRYVADPVNGVLLVVGQVARTWGGNPSSLSNAYERYVPVSVRTGLAAAAWYKGLEEVENRAVEENWISEHDAIFPQNRDDGDEFIFTPSPTSSPPAGLGNGSNSGNAGSNGTGFGGGSAD